MAGSLGQVVTKTLSEDQAGQAEMEEALAALEAEATRTHAGAAGFPQSPQGSEETTLVELH